ncbi:MAG: hypothetical protein QOE45_2164 [Frankiaceae bacterium]|jgi:hypothetical protein|nr:hypothetical protein [Frankiaceae bacterium]
MSHLRLVPPLAGESTEASAATPWEDPKVARMFFQAASGVCLCRGCSMKRHPAYGLV